MASHINTNNINTLYPIAGQDNDTEGFRVNFRNIKDNLNTAATEITDIQDAVAKSPQIKYAGNNVDNAVQAPSTSSDAGVKGQIAWGPDPDSPDYLYICIASDPSPKWIRVSVESW